MNPALPTRRALALAGLLVAALPLACNGDDSGTTESTTASGTTTGDTTTDSTTGSSTDSTTGSSTEGTASGSTTAAETTAASSTHDHSTTQDTDATGTTDTTTGGSPAEDYCICMLTNCHEFYHGTWGEDHEISEQMCLAVAEALDADHFACRLEHCEAAAQDEALCADAIGGGECM